MNKPLVLICIEAVREGAALSMAAAFLRPTAGVAEPATWAMMMLGFVGLGAVADRKRAAFKAA
jgi:hypothetical protein